jgi:hypothetical protein
VDAFEVRLATRADEPEIRALVAATAMPGAVAVRFAREPDYFLGTTIMGDPCDVVVVRERRTGQLAGIGCRAERRAFVNGREERIGYIGQIRAAEGYRGRWLVQRAMAWLRESGHADLLYYGVVARENPRARELLVGRRAPGMPLRTRLAGLTTCAILLRPRRPPRILGLELEPGFAGTIPEIVEFLRDEGARRQLFPAYTIEDFTGGRTLRGLAPGDVAVARRAGRIVGMAAWTRPPTSRTSSKPTGRPCAVFAPRASPSPAPSAPGRSPRPARPSPLHSPPAPAWPTMIRRSCAPSSRPARNERASAARPT